MNTVCRQQKLALTVSLIFKKQSLIVQLSP